MLRAPLFAATKRAMSTSTATNAFHSRFQQYALQLDATNERRERLVKASRDVTIHSKKVIFVIHRLNDSNRDKIVEQAEKDLAAVRDAHVSRVAREVEGVDYWKLKRAFSPGMQEFVEAATVVEFCKTGKLLTLQQLNSSLCGVKDASGVSFSVDIDDYLLGIADLSGELMRLAVSSAASGQGLEASARIRGFVQALYEGFCLLFYNVDGGRDMTKKVEVMLQSLVKIETTCYSMHVRGSEYPASIVDS
ncbi:hypothetical protein SELMODRAFT_233937 [Selaginella moellendorffii]|uniref:Translin-associated protein X n=1 Tax=Selaginella moellendorffii TaxID=88036 RepID=D8SFW9_SELML|nr:translin-associated protein X [Selaginella moellendorffii]XP_024522877.1 translin-associated protein X [Selaginella moellendorffii]XP_024542925.1 translin-associated protein X [Selaginella moellendorffii]EFJ05514.1 hypothetical protein SELMODRAFT_229756 [Selaginella moellendorffii]EFJ16801.1 hypothetical protein SELMODRAFT_233937 [Selaginella moellendorffii]|eukprot:XP_002982133.1 translin-associated protein X [Selaginella moellendorffii]